MIRSTVALPTGETLRAIATGGGAMPAGEDLVATVDRLARDDPRRPAVVTPQGSTDFATLAGLSRALATRIGIASKAPVLVLGETGLLLVVAIIACRRTGRTVVPVDSSMSPLRIRQVMMASGADVLVRHEGEVPPIPELAPDRIRTVLSGALDPTAETAPARSGEEAFLIFTSGSTGVPKGVCHDPTAMVDAIALLNATIDARDGDRIALVTPATTLTGVVSSVAGLSAGASVLLLSDRASVHALMDLLERGRATQLMSYVGLARAVAAHPRARSAFRHMRCLLVYGDVIRAEDCDALRSVLPPDGQIRLLYGASEAMLAAACTAEPGLAGRDGRMPLGRPLPGMELWLRVAADAAPGEEFGELCLGGPRVTKGYRRDRGADDAKFLPHPYDPGRRLFCIGDLVGLRPDGLLDFAGRADNQVKLRGWRIELEEIETAALGIPGVSAAGAVARRGPDGIVAEIALHAEAPGLDEVGRAALARRIDAELSRSLPAAMVPSAIVTQATLPRTPTGKIDRLRLAELDRREQDRARTFRADEPDSGWPDPLSARIAAAIADECGLSGLAPHDDLNELGVDSLQAVNAVLRIEKQWAVVVEPTDLLAGNPVGAMVAAIATQAR